MPHLVAYLVALVTLLAFDAVWLGYAMADFYQAQIGHLMAEQIRFDAVALFYPAYTAGVLFFVILPASKTGSQRQALLHGALFGVIAYMTYDLSNLATLRGWPVIVVVADVAWGAFVTAAMSVAGHAAAQRSASKTA